ncbi:hypothetical protein [Kangiella sp.]|uniref:DUF7674 family protein n=1 Tax=Kangiella sp. TaxID=1920245 RepID=UPI0019CABF3F|nr:hypothetical protein [Kangiella sp.]MBD3654378.1 hypothetical protein [Kangiella sp.]
MTVLEMYDEFRTLFPEVTTVADDIHIQAWGSLDPEYSFSWYESLAKAINQEMTNEVVASRYAGLFEYVRKQYLLGDDEVKKCIDASFTENLFWQVKPEKAKSYWQLLPDILKTLYVNFHGRPPA